MKGRAVYGAVLAALGLAVCISLGRRSEGNGVEPAEGRLGASVSASGQSPGASETAGGELSATRLERRLDLLAAKLAAEAEQRRRLEQRIEVLTTELTRLRGSGHETAQAVDANLGPVAAAPMTGAAPNGAADPSSGADGTTAMERALVAAGVDATTATEIRRRRDQLSLSEIYLRDQAAREGWQDTPRFATEMAEIERQRTSVREEIGDDAYDRYLAALDQPNRVAVNEVMLDSPAATAGLQAGDKVLRYGETRIFDPSELVSATRSGIAGETVRMEILRQGQQIEIVVPRGPLGITIAASKGVPGEG